MPVATPKQYETMLNAAQKGGYAYPAVNITSIVTINAALKAFADARSDGIIQVSTEAYLLLVLALRMRPSELSCLPKPPMFWRKV